MTPMNRHCEKFQRLLRELFQFDCADLDFGIYRIMNYKRGAVEKFIAEDLPNAVAEELTSGNLADQARAAGDLTETARRVEEALGEDALDAAGNLDAIYRSTPLGRKYLKLQAMAAGARSREALEAVVFNHLFAFFSRYYQDGDFISKRRYSKRRRYAIPYNGEEVYLYWANNDQYYIKTAEHFHDYAFTARGVTAHFKMQAASVEQNNVKGDRRFFLPRIQDIAWDEKAGQVVIPFEYRPLTEREEAAYGAKNRQDAIIAKALADIRERLQEAGKASAALMAERRKTDKGESVGYLEHHLRQYVRKNTSDFFIHKDLKGFLSGELDFYLKNEVLNLDEMQAAGEQLAEGWFQIVRVIKSVGGRIIDFLDQIECFQKMLWEKRKFITETQYCITVGSIDESFYPDIAACEPQWTEWNELFHIDEKETNLFNSGKDGNGKRVAFLKDHPTLVLDTKHFTPVFNDRLLALFNLDEMTDGLLIHSENFQSLRMLSPKYDAGIECVYIDPPYNTDASAIIYKNGYKDSSWLMLMENGLSMVRTLLPTAGVLCCAIDDEEAWRLRALMQNMFARELGIVPVRTNPAGRKSTERFSPAHEYAFFFGMDDSVPSSLPKTDKENGRYPFVDDQGRYAWNNLIRHGSGDRREDVPTMFYPIYVGSDDAIRVPPMEWDNGKREYRVLETPGPEEVAVWPVRDGIEKRWHRGWERVGSEPGDYRVRRGDDDRISIDFRIRMDEGAMPKTWWDDSRYASSNHGAKILKDLFVENPFDFPKSVALVEDCVRASGGADATHILDYFAGSGATGHAVVNLNREDGGRRKFILVEMGGYFDTVLVPRIKKITFTPEWKDGKPKRMATQQEAERGPRIVKYMRLESYEDALDNIGFDDAAGRQALKFEDYLLKYMLKWETRASETLLNVEKLARPFHYKLHVHAAGRTREKIADIPETFNYLLGLHVQARQVYDDDGRRYLVYRGRIDRRRAAVIWRETEGWGKADLDRDKKFVAEQKLAEGADEVFVNGDSFIPNAKALEPLFKARMFAGAAA